MFARSFQICFPDSWELWKNVLASLGLGFLFCEMGTMKGSPSQGHEDSLKCGREMQMATLTTPDPTLPHPASPLCRPSESALTYR